MDGVQLRRPSCSSEPPAASSPLCRFPHLRNQCPRPIPEIARGPHCKQCLASRAIRRLLQEKTIRRRTRPAPSLATLPRPVLHLRKARLLTHYCGPRTYLRQQIVGIVLSGDHGLKLRPLLGLNGGLAAAIWGTVVLAATLPSMRRRHRRCSSRAVRCCRRGPYRGRATEPPPVPCARPATDWQARVTRGTLD